MATGILLPACHNQHQNRSSASSINSDASTSRFSASTASRRIRFAPLPDPHRAVLITDDGDELPISLPQDAELNHIPTSLLISSPPASPRHPLNSLSDIRPDPSDERENSSGSSYLSSSSSTSASSTSTPRTTTPSDVSPISSLTSSPVTANSALPATKCTPPLLNSQSAPPSAWPKPRYISNLLPFKRSSTSSSSSSSHSLTPTPSIEYQGQGHAQTARKAVAPSLSLFRTSSRDSTDSASTAHTSGWGLGLSRWTSANGIEKPAATSINGSSPLARTQSTQSYKSKTKKSLFTPSSSSSASSSSSEVQKSQSAGPKLPGQNRYKGARMLNGRVYGSKRPATANANPFANARDDDVEFVEWGYGGMGSVKGAKSAGMAGGSGNRVNWERLQGGASARQGVGGGFGVTDDDGDDGSGMGWVKKRREEREKKKKEAEELAAKEKEKEAQQGQSDQEVADSTKSTPTPTRTSTMDGMTAEDDPTSAATIVPSTYTAAEKEEVKETETENVEADKSKGELKEGFVFGGTVVDEPLEQEKEREHMPVAVLVPVRPRHHHHHHSSHSHRHARSLSKDGLLDEGSCDQEHDESTVAVAAVEQHVGGERDKRASISSQSASESESETEDEDEEGGDDDEEEEDEDEEDESKVTSGRKQRKTALGAGVEKISRHKEKE